MLFRQLLDYESFTYTYLIASGGGCDAVLIDPVKKHVDQYLQLLKELDLKLVAAIDTHMHADHVTAIGLLNQRTNCESVIGKESQATCATRTVSDGEVLQFDGFQLDVIYTPGHTDDSYCFVMGDCVFTGDTLLIRGTGRTDFQHGDSASQYESILNKLFHLPDATKVYPGHDYNGMTVSTIGEEKRYNLRLKNKTKEAYVALMDNLNLPKPKMMHIAVPANQKCGLEV